MDALKPENNNMCCSHNIPVSKTKKKREHNHHIIMTGVFPQKKRVFVADQTRLCLMRMYSATYSTTSVSCCLFAIIIVFTLFLVFVI